MSALPMVKVAGISRVLNASTGQYSPVATTLGRTSMGTIRLAAKRLYALETTNVDKATTLRKYRIQYLTEGVSSIQEVLLLIRSPIPALLRELAANPSLIHFSNNYNDLQDKYREFE